MSGSEASVQEDSRGPGCPRWPPEEEPGTPLRGQGGRRPVSCRDAAPLLFCPLSQDELQLISSHQLNSRPRAGGSSSSDGRWRVRAPPGLGTEGASIRVERV